MMTSTQISAILALAGDTMSSPAHVKNVTLSSGHVFSVNTTAGVPGRYLLSFMDADQIAVFTPNVPESAGPETTFATEFVSYSDIASVGMFPSA